MLAPSQFGLDEALADLAPLLKQSLEPGQMLRLEPAIGSGTVHVDRNRLDQALLNLTLNARDAMPLGGTLALCTRRASIAAGALFGPEGERLAAGEYLVVTLTDSGGGMDAETRRRALEPFFTTKSPGQGTGLGLSMAYGFARQSGGTLVIESESGRGTSVSLYLPLAHGEPPEHPEAARATRIAPSRGEQVLIVDDEPSVRAAMRRALEDHGYRVLEASSGPGALARLEAASGVHLIVCDLVMPEMSGAALGSAIAQRWPELPVLYVSGFPGVDAAGDGMLPAGATLLKKPFALEDLVARVRAALDGG